MFLFKYGHKGIFERTGIHLHSTMFLFKCIVSAFCIQTIIIYIPLCFYLNSISEWGKKADLYLHSTMFLFKSVSSHLNNSTACNHHFCLRTLKFKITYSSYDTQIHQDLINSVLSTLRNFYII